MTISTIIATIIVAIVYLLLGYIVARKSNANALLYKSEIAPRITFGYILEQSIGYSLLTLLSLTLLSELVNIILLYLFTVTILALITYFEFSRLILAYFTDNQVILYQIFAKDNLIIEPHNIKCLFNIQARRFKFYTINILVNDNEKSFTLKESMYNFDDLKGYFRRHEKPVYSKNISERVSTRIE